VLKIAPETSIKLALNDYLKREIVQAQPGEPISPLQRLLCGGLAGAVGQVGGGWQTSAPWHLPALLHGRGHPPGA
jgi:hypothetical protein